MAKNVLNPTSDGLFWNHITYVRPSSATLGLVRPALFHKKTIIIKLWLFLKLDPFHLHLTRKYHFQIILGILYYGVSYLHKKKNWEIYNFFMITLWLFIMVLYYSSHDIFKRKIKTCSIILIFCANFTNFVRFPPISATLCPSSAAHSTSPFIKTQEFSLVMRKYEQEIKFHIITPSVYQNITLLPFLKTILKG